MEASATLRAYSVWIAAKIHLGRTGHTACNSERVSSWTAREETGILGACITERAATRFSSRRVHFNDRLSVEYILLIVPRV